MFFLDQVILFLENYDIYWLFFEFFNTFSSLLGCVFFFPLFFKNFFFLIDCDVIIMFVFYSMSTNMINALTMSLKFLVCIALLIFARGGIPRFRFDYLTKLGWIRFLSLVLLAFLIEILIINTF